MFGGAAGGGGYPGEAAGAGLQPHVQTVSPLCENLLNQGESQVRRRQQTLQQHIIRTDNF